MKFNLGRDSEPRFGQDFKVKSSRNAKAWLRFWRWSLCKFVIWPKEVSLVKQNSILGSIVPLAMFYNYSIFSDPIFYFENCFSSFSQNIKFENIYYSNEIFSRWMDCLQSSGMYIAACWVDRQPETAGKGQDETSISVQGVKCNLQNGKCKVQNVK